MLATIVTGLGGLFGAVSSSNERKAMEAAAKAREKELQAQLAMMGAQQEHQKELLLYGSLAAGALALIVSWK